MSLHLKILVCMVVACALCAGLLIAQAKAPKGFATPSSKEVAARLLEAKGGRMAKVGFALQNLHGDLTSGRLRSSTGSQTWSPDNPLVRMVGDSVVIDAVASGDPQALLADLQEMGLQKGAVFGRMVSGLLPMDSIDELAACPTLKYASPSGATTRAGLVTTQGDEATNSDVVRSQLGIDGSGRRVGAMSDSYDCLGGAAAGQASDDVMADVIILDDSACGGTLDEARAILEIIHDLAPGADGAVHTAFNGQADFAQGIIELAQAGADVIIDDVIYFAEPMFMDGIIAQAVDTVTAQGVAYFSSAGNGVRNAYEDNFRNSGQTGAFGGLRHDFDPGAGTDGLQTITVGSGQTVFSFQWDNPFFSVTGGPSATADLDFLFYDTSGNFLPFLSSNPVDGELVATFQGGSDNINVTGDPVEVAAILNFGAPFQVQVGLELFAGPAPSFVKYVFFNRSTNVDEFDTASGTLYGHTNAVGAEGVGAARYTETPAFGVDPALIEFFSSAGPTPIFFKTDGTPTSELRLKPEIVAPNGGNNTFFPPPPFNPSDIEGDGFPNFFGTSASAPHAAAVGALLKQVDDSLAPAQIHNLLEITARDMDDPDTPGFDVGFDFRTGHGLVDAFAAALEAARDGNDGDKFKICHIPAPGEPMLDISIFMGSLQDHLDHGDKFGTCPSS
ncbi:MAG: S8 family serine peptidase [Acidobacteriota bacterium]